VPGQVAAPAQMTRAKYSSKVQDTGRGPDPEKLYWTHTASLGTEPDEPAWGSRSVLTICGGAAIGQGEYPLTVAMFGLMLF
jgi:hypothetical protein